MGVCKIRKLFGLIFILSMIIGNLPPAGQVAAAGPAQTDNSAAVPAPEETAVPDPSPSPSQTPDITPPAATLEPTPSPTPVPDKYVLTSPGAKYGQGGQTGIHYHRVRGKKIYHISSYTTDTVRLTMSQPSLYSVYGGGSRKEVKKGYVTVSSGGLVKCNRKGKGEKVCTIIKAVSKTTGEVQYIYINFQKKISCSNGNKIVLYERYSEQMKLDYSFSKVSVSVGNNKLATVSKRGNIRALKHGTTYIVVKVKGSQKNEVRIRLVVKKEPWIVSARDRVYDYEDMTKDLHALTEKYPGKSGLESIGSSYDDRRIWCLRIGNKSASDKLVINAAIHGREWKNSQIIMRQAEELLREYRDFQKRFNKTCIYIIPMDNPDGVSISQYGFSSIRDKKLRKKCKKLGHSDIWKANARGVNLNNNFPAGFHKYKKKPHYMYYFGKKAGSERETRALMKFINRVVPRAVINLHSTGSILYWDFSVEDKLHEKLYALASRINSFNKYMLMPKGTGTNMAGGFADWLNYKKEITSVTVETGTVMCPLPHSQYKSIYKKNNKMFRWFMTEY